MGEVRGIGLNKPPTMCSYVTLSLVETRVGEASLLSLTNPLLRADTQLFRWSRRVAEVSVFSSV